MKRIAILDDYQGVALTSADWPALAARATVRAFREHIPGEAALADALADFEIIVAMRERTAFPRSLLSRLPKLELLATTGFGNAAIDVAAAKELGITVTGTRAWSPATLEHTWALILACAKRLVECDHDIRAGDWQRHISTDLAGSRLGIIGLGNYGGRVAAIAKAFGMDVVAWSTNLTDQRCAEVGVTRLSKEELLATSDFVTIHQKLSSRSRGLIGESDLRSMRPSAYLINTSRGPVVDEAALLRALRERWIAGAGLDVYDIEPVPADHPLLRLPNVVLTPHMGYVTWRTWEVFFSELVANIDAFLNGKVLRPLIGWA